MNFVNSKDQVASTACRYFILGAVVGVGLGDGSIFGADGKATERRRTHFCAPDDLSQDTLVAVFLHLADLDLKVYPDDAKLPAIAVVNAAMHHAYPCTKRN